MCAGAIEKGSRTVAFGAYAQVLFVLGLEKDLLKLGSDDVLGRNFRMRKYSLKNVHPN